MRVFRRGHGPDLNWVAIGKPVLRHNNKTKKKLKCRKYMTTTTTEKKTKEEIFLKSYYNNHWTSCTKTVRLPFFLFFVLFHVNHDFVDSFHIWLTTKRNRPIFFIYTSCLVPWQLFGLFSFVSSLWHLWLWGRSVWVYTWCQCWVRVDQQYRTNLQLEYRTCRRSFDWDRSCTSLHCWLRDRLCSWCILKVSIMCKNYALLF